MKVLNLYAGIGGNRKLWEGVEVTAVEKDPQIAAIYQDYFPQDKMIIGDAHEYLLKEYKNFDFIWSSFPCQSHSRSRYWSSKGGMYDEVYPDFGLYQEIIFLKHFNPGSYVVENVMPYYQPLIPPTAKIERHYFWANFKILPVTLEAVERDHQRISSKHQLYGFDISEYELSNRKDQIIRNLVNPDLGLYILEQALGVAREKKKTQTNLFQ